MIYQLSSNYVLLYTIMHLCKNASIYDNKIDSFDDNPVDHSIISGLDWILYMSTTWTYIYMCVIFIYVCEMDYFMKWVINLTILCLGAIPCLSLRARFSQRGMYRKRWNPCIGHHRFHINLYLWSSIQKRNLRDEKKNSILSSNKVVFSLSPSLLNVFHAGPSVGWITAKSFWIQCFLEPKEISPYSHNRHAITD